MLTYLKSLLRELLAPGLYGGGMILILTSVFRRVEYAAVVLAFLIPQPNIWYKLHKYPLGNNFMDLLYFAVVLGCFVQGRRLRQSDNGWIILSFMLLAYASLWNSSARFSLPPPVTTANYLLFDLKNYVQMIGLYFLVQAAADKEDRRTMILLAVSLAFFLIALKSYRNFSGGESFSYGRRAGGPFETVGLGANHFGAFAVEYGALLLGMFLYDDDKRRKLLFLAGVLFGLHPLLFSYSRGAYLAAVCVMGFFGLYKKRLVLILAAFMLSWTAIVPASVVDRVTMTTTEDGEIEHSALGRIGLWNLAMEIFHEAPLFGVGYGGFTLSAGGRWTSTGEVVREGGVDVHSFYLRTLCEQGIVGFLLFVFVLYRGFRSGWRLFSMAATPSQRGLGMGFMGCVIATSVTNVFGDRWSYYVLGGYFWIVFGLVDATVRELRSDRVSLEHP